MGIIGRIIRRRRRRLLRRRIKPMDLRRRRRRSVVRGWSSGRRERRNGIKSVRERRVIVGIRRREIGRRRGRWSVVGR